MLPAHDLSGEIAAFKDPPYPVQSGWPLRSVVGHAQIDVACKDVLLWWKNHLKHSNLRHSRSHGGTHTPRAGSMHALCMLRNRTVTTRNATQHARNATHRSATEPVPSRPLDYVARMLLGICNIALKAANTERQKPTSTRASSAKSMVCSHRAWLLPQGPERSVWGSTFDL